MRAIFTIVFLTFQIFGIYHNINMSVTDITLKENKLEMKIKYFADDLQGSLSSANNLPVDLVNTPIEQNESKIKKYTDERLKIMVNNVPIKWKFKRAFLNNDVMMVEYAALFKDSQKIKSIQVKNLLMFDDFPEQKNIVNIHIHGKDEILAFENGKDKKFKQIMLIK